MTITRKYLNRWEKSARIYITPEQKLIILDRFGTEPTPYEWSEQDIAIQIQNYLGCGEFVKLIHSNNGESIIPVDEPF